MKRHIEQDLLDWRASPRRKPLVLRGARQVGKTYLLKSFGKSHYEHIAYIDFEEEEDVRTLFDGNIKPKVILEKLGIYLKQPIKPHNTLIIFDEIQSCPNALNSLKYFYEKANEYHIIAAGSLLGITLANTKGFPVGKVNFMTMYPLTFNEFMHATEEHELCNYIESLSTFNTIDIPLHNKLLYLLKKYFFIGGMPEVVHEYSQNKEITHVRTVQNEILDAYLLDFSKHAPTTDILKITQIWNSIPKQLSKENKKFLFSAVKSSARAREYENALTWLSNANLIHKVNNVAKPSIPLKSVMNEEIFKIYCHDIGLLGALSNTPEDIILKDNLIFDRYKGAFTENFVLQELISHKKEDLYYWTSQGNAELDFIFQEKDQIYPIEVKSGKAKKAKSLWTYKERYSPKKLFCISSDNVKIRENIYYYPLYLISRLPNLS